ncbi:MAG: hypothetical protein KGS72_27020 [Cyanobacteria bacterium REEB67]|nr:hypothetical protein [Cyanobacteria bacterium REEB67]
MAFFDWHNYLLLAEKLLAEIPDKPSLITDLDRAAIRCGISRAYYAAFWSAQNYLKNADPHYPISGDTHDNVIRDIKCCGKKGAVGVGNTLSNLKIKRRMADYEAKHDLKRADLISVIATAKIVITGVNQF